MSTKMHDVLKEQSQGFEPAQKEYLEGFFAGVKTRGIAFSDVEPTPEPVENVRLTKEEKIKNELHPLDAFPELRRKAREDLPPEPQDIFRFKSNGLFWLEPVHTGYMCRLRIPGGMLKAFQFRELGRIAKDIAGGYLQITTRSNVQIRIVKPKDTTELLRRIEAVGLHARGSGADNIRNLTISPTAGIDPYELIDTAPYVRDLAQLIMNDREFYNLPRKFNISFNGGGMISTAEDTNDIGMRAFRMGGEIFFHVLLGGVTGHQEFAEHSGVICSPDQVVEVAAAITKIFARNGNRSNRGKARLVYLLKDWGFEKFTAAVESELGYELRRCAEDDAAAIGADEQPEVPHPHLGVHPQKQAGLHYIGLSTPVGLVESELVESIADVAEKFGSGELRLTIFENVLVPNIPTEHLGAAKAALDAAGISYGASNLRGGLVACTGNRYCKFSAADTKGHGIALTEFLDGMIELDQPINIHVTGCPHSCAQHYVGDIGLLGCKVEAAEGESDEGFHVFVGGGFGRQKNFGRQLFKSLRAGDELQRHVLALLQAFQAGASGEQSFQAWVVGNSVEELVTLARERL